LSHKNFSGKSGEIRAKYPSHTQDILIYAYDMEMFLHAIQT